MNIYIATSRRNPDGPRLASLLRDAGHRVHTIQRAKAQVQWPTESDSWCTEALQQHLHEDDDCARAALEEAQAIRGADACLLVLPCGVGGHLAAGAAIGAGVPTVVLLANGEPEVLYAAAACVAANEAEALAALAALAVMEGITTEGITK